MSLIELAPCDIRFSQDTIHNRFRNGKNVNQTISNIESGFNRVEDFPKISVMLKDGLYYTLDNRRLYVFRVLQKRGHLEKIEVFLFSFLLFGSKFTTKNQGLSISVRGGITYPHTSSSLQSKASVSTDRFSSLLGDDPMDSLFSSYLMSIAGRRSEFKSVNEKETEKLEPSTSTENCNTPSSSRCGENGQSSDGEQPDHKENHQPDEQTDTDEQLSPHEQRNQGENSIGKQDHFENPLFKAESEDKLVIPPNLDNNAMGLLNRRPIEGTKILSVVQSASVTEMRLIPDKELSTHTDEYNKPSCSHSMEDKQSSNEDHSDYKHHESDEQTGKKIHPGLHEQQNRVENAKIGKQPKQDEITSLIKIQHQGKVLKSEMQQSQENPLNIGTQPHQEEPECNLQPMENNQLDCEIPNKNIESNEQPGPEKSSDSSAQPNIQSNRYPVIYWRESKYEKIRQDLLLSLADSDDDFDDYNDWGSNAYIDSDGHSDYWYSNNYYDSDDDYLLY